MGMCVKDLYRGLLNFNGMCARFCVYHAMLAVL